MLTHIFVPTVCFVTSLVGARGGSASQLVYPASLFCCHAQKFVCCSTVPSEVRLVPPSVPLKILVSSVPPSSAWGLEKKTVFVSASLGQLSSFV